MSVSPQPASGSDTIEDFTQSSDAVVWARAFQTRIAERLGVDLEADMIGWIANAMARGEADAMRRCDQEIAGLRGVVRHLSEYTNTYLDDVDAIPTPSDNAEITERERGLVKLIAADRILLHFAAVGLSQIASGMVRIFED